LNTTLCDKVCQWPATGRWFSPCTLWVWIPHIARCTQYNIMWYSLSVTCDRSVVYSGYSTNKTNRHDISKILMKVAVNTINQTKLNWLQWQIEASLQYKITENMRYLIVHLITRPNLETNTVTQSTAIFIWCIMDCFQ
jgi:hypothetical protein